MGAAMQVVLLERIESLGKMGDVVRVKPGYARNYLLPQKKALRATESNLAYFESQRAALEKLNEGKKAEAQKQTKHYEGLTVIIIRHAAEGGQLYGSVSARDVADAARDQAKMEIGRNQIELNQGLKTLGLFPVSVALHPEVKATITVNIARSEEEAKQQRKTGKAVTSGAGAPDAGPSTGGSAANAGEMEQPDLDEAAKRFLEQGAFEAQQRNAAADASEAAEGNEEKSARAAKRSSKKKSKADYDDEDED